MKFVKKEVYCLVALYIAYNNRNTDAIKSRTAITGYFIIKMTMGIINTTTTNIPKMEPSRPGKNINNAKNARKYHMNIYYSAPGGLARAAVHTPIPCH